MAPTSISVQLQPFKALGVAADGIPAIVLASAIGLTLVLRALRRGR